MLRYATIGVQRLKGIPRLRNYLQKYGAPRNLKIYICSCNEQLMKRPMTGGNTMRGLTKCPWRIFNFKHILPNQKLYLASHEPARPARRCSGTSTPALTGWPREIFEATRETKRTTHCANLQSSRGCGEVSK